MHDYWIGLLHFFRNVYILILFYTFMDIPNIVGCLELRLGTETFQCGTVTDGHKVFEFLQSFLELLKKTPNLTREEYAQWYKVKTAEIFSSLVYHPPRLDNLVYDIVIDATRRIIFHTPDRERLIQPLVMHELTSKHGYQFFSYIQLSERLFVPDANL